MDFLRLFASPVRPPACFLEGRVGFAIGDIHGRADLLSAMLDLLEERAAAETRSDGAPIVVFLGDYVDRGRESARVIDLLLSGRPRGFERRFLRGNHEQSMAAFMEAPTDNLAWVLYGGAETLMSYGVSPPSLVQGSEAEWAAAAEALKAKTPPSHHAFLAQLERYVVLGDYVFAHAGVDPSQPLEKQTDADLYWIRDRFLNRKRRFSHRVVHGHTPIARPYMDERRVSIDTGAYASGVLTAARFEGAEVSFLFAEDQARG